MNILLSLFDVVIYPISARQLGTYKVRIESYTIWVYNLYVDDDDATPSSRYLTNQCENRYVGIK